MQPTRTPRARTARILLLFLLLTGLQPPRGAGAQPAMGPPAVGVVRAERTPIVETNEFIGRIEAVNRVALVARVTAFLEQRSFVEGSEVSKGDLLYTLEQGPFEADVMAKQAALGQVSALLENANQTLGRQQALLNTPAGQRSNLDSAIAQQRSLAAQKLAAEANLQTSQINLAYTEIHAPIDGKISRTNVTEGNVVGPTTGTLATIVSQDPMYVVFPISSRTVLDLRQRYANHGGFNAVLVKLRLPNGRIYAQDGKLDYIDPTISATTDTLTARAILPNPPLPGPPDKSTSTRARELVDGEFVQVLVQGVTPIEVLGVPRAAILSDQQGDYVYTVGSDNKVTQARVQLGQSTPTTASVVNGLSEGQMVVVEGIQRIHPGITVVPGPASPGPAVPPSSQGH
jgi:membrane fusion protein (multidrug efflux system)